MSQLDTVIERDVVPSAGTVDMKLEVVVIPVSDVKRAKRFYSNLGWRLDADFVRGDAFRVVQFTPPGSSCSIQFCRSPLKQSASNRCGNRKYSYQEAAHGPSASHKMGS